jgi:hypothetical protein
MSGASAFTFLSDDRYEYDDDDTYEYDDDDRYENEDDYYASDDDFYTFGYDSDDDSIEGYEGDHIVGDLDDEYDAIYEFEASASEGERDLYQFDLQDGAVVGANEFDDGRWESEFIKPNESYQVNEDGTIVKTEVKRFGTEIETYADLDGDGLYSKVGRTWESNSSSSETTTIKSRYDDWYEFSGELDEFELIGTPDQVVVTSLSDGSSQSIEAAERVLFSNGARAYDIDGRAGKAYRIYKAAFDRDPMEGDTDGLGYWIAQMDNGMDMVEVAERFIDSAEFRSVYGENPSNEEFLNKIYLNVLDRLPDEEGYAWWMDQLENNPEKTWEKVLADFSESAENQANVADLVANGIAFDPWVG